MNHFWHFTATQMSLHLQMYMSGNHITNSLSLIAEEVVEIH